MNSVPKFPQALFYKQENFLQAAANPSTTFKKRKGTTDKGKDYEHLYMAHLILKLTIDDTIKNFQLSSNDDDYGAFDDVIAEIERSTGEKTIYAIQLKHIDGVKTLTKDALSTSSKKANFSITKYFQEAQHVATTDVPIKFIILTNNRFGVSDNGEIVLGDDESRVVISKSDKEAVINTCDAGNCYRFRAKVPGSKYDDFFDKFELYTDQVNVDRIKIDTRNEFMREFACDGEIFEKYVKFVNEWSIPDGQKPKLDKTMMKQIVAMFLMSPYTQNLVFDDGAVTDETKLLQEAVSKFRVTLCSKNHTRILRKLWKDCKSGLPRDMGVLKRGAKKYQIIRPGVNHVKDLNDDETMKLLWLMGVCPLVVTDHESVRRAIKLCQNVVVLLVEESHDFDDSFRKLSDLSGFPEIFDNVVRKFGFSMQGKDKIALENLVQVDRRVADVVTTNELLLMSEGKFVVGGKGEILPPCHVERRLSRNVVDHQTILRLQNCVLFVSSVQDNDNFGGKNVVKVDESFFGGNHRHMEETIYVVEDDCSWLLFDTFCHTIGGFANCHHFRYVDGNFEWMASRNGLGDLKQHLLEGYHVEEKSLQRYEFHRNMNIVCADPGMGKTTLMQSLKNQISSDLWTVLIYARNHSRHFREHADNMETFHEHVLDQAKKNLSDFDVEIFEIMREQNLVRYIWDGLDEVSTMNVDAVLSIIDKLHHSGVQQWVTSRYNMKEKLEMKFRIPSTTLTPFDDTEQKRYIQQRLDCTPDEMLTIFDKIKTNIQLFPYNDILGIPLQIFIITELFRKNMQKYLVILDEVFSIADLYDHFVDEKFQVYNIGKEKADDDNDLVYERIQTEKKQRVYQYEKAALSVYLPHDLVTKWSIKWKKFLTELQNGKDRFGIIIHVDDDNLVQFVHNSFGEYFTALYLSKHLERVPETRSFWFDDRYSNIRFFFDLMLAMNKAHVAVLYRNTNLLAKCDEDEIISKDKGGRNVLQLISSWGLRCPDLNIETKNGAYIIDKENIDMSRFRKGESWDHCTILDKLKKLFPLEETDHLFQMSSFSYASKSSSLLSLAMLTWSSSITDDFTQKSILIFFYCAVADYVQIFDIMDVPYVKTTDHLLEFLLIDTQSVKSLRRIVNLEDYKKNLSQRNSDGLLFQASKGGNAEIMQLLIDNGANLDARAIGIEEMRPMVMVAIQGHYQAAKVLVDNGADVNITDRHGYSPIHAACQYQHYDIVKLLVDNKAKLDNPDNRMGTPLHHCLTNGNYEIAQLLCESGADVNKRPPHLKTLEPKLRYNMILKKYPKLARLLLQHGYSLLPSLEEKVVQLKQRIRMLRYILGKLERGEIGA